MYVYNKIDSVSIDFLDKLAREPHTVVMSCELDLGIQDVVEMLARASIDENLHEAVHHLTPYSTKIFRLTSV